VDYIGMVGSPGYKKQGLAIQTPRIGKRKLSPEQAKSLKAKLKNSPYEAMGTGKPSHALSL
jgi:hypothetical protein